MLYYGGNWLVDGAARLARSFGISALVVGLTVVSFGTSMPELMVSLSAVFTGTSDISVGNVIGSNIANIGLILGISAIIFPISIHIMLVRREIPILILITLFSAFAFSDGRIGRDDGAILVAGLIAFNALMLYFASQDRKEKRIVDIRATQQIEQATIMMPNQRPREVMRLLIGLVVLSIGAQLTVTGAISVARAFGISELVIGVTLVAVGTSLPELATSVTAAIRGQSDIAIGNVVGSNVYNLLAILGFTALIRPIPLFQTITFRPYNELLQSPVVVDYETFYQVTRVDGPVMLGFTLLLLPLVLNKRIERWEGFLLVGLYIAFSVFAFVR